MIKRNLIHTWEDNVNTEKPNKWSFLRLPVSCQLISGASNQMRLKDFLTSNVPFIEPCFGVVVISSLVMLWLCLFRKCSLIAPFCRWNDNLRDSVHVCQACILTRLFVIRFEDPDINRQDTGKPRKLHYTPHCIHSTCPWHYVWVPWFTQCQQQKRGRFRS